jgi:cold shock CspA family protein
MRFAIGEVRVEVIIDDDDFELPLGGFLPGSDTHDLMQHRGVLEPEFLDFDRGIVKFAVQSFVIRVSGRTLLVDTCIGEQKDRPDIPVWHQRRGTGFLERLASRHRSDGCGYCFLHASSCRSRRMEHATRGRAVGADVSERPLFVRPH